MSTILVRDDRNGQVVLRYCDPTGRVTDAANPNGSVAGIAGVCNEGGNVLGLMPHPECAADPELPGQDGVALFEALTCWGRGGWDGVAAVTGGVSIAGSWPA